MQSEVDVEMDVQEDGPSLARIPFERFLELVVEMVKSNVKTLAGKVRDNAAEIDRVAAQLTPASGPSAANCAAVYRDDHDLVAWNTNLLTKARDYYGCNAGPGAGVWDYVTDNTLGKHAEMKILDDQAFNEMTGGNFSGVYIGISKPCCLPCAAVMAIAGISTRGRHADKNTNWAFPRYILDSEDRWKRFLGAKATEALAERGLSSTQRSMFRGRLVQQL